jgi:ribosomal protein S18 acetylase RimI-like enzyme
LDCESGNRTVLPLILLLIRLKILLADNKTNKYICIVEDVLNNPVWQALISADAHLGYGTGSAKYFDEAISPFVGFPQDHEQGFNELYELLPAGRKILYATPHLIKQPEAWQVLHEIKGLQFVFAGTISSPIDASAIVPLNKSHVEEMMHLAALTKPGPFGPRTIEFGYYHGVFQDGQLAAMTGQRLHVDGFTEISAVCTHPDHLGKGFAGTLLQHQVQLICNQGQTPFLHVRDDNQRAIALYERLGFQVRGPMNFYFMKK